MRTRFLPALLLTIFLFQCTNDTTTTSDNNPSELTSEMSASEFEKQEVAPPVSKVDVAYNYFAFNPEEEKTIKLENGTSIVIPSNAFIDSNGNPVTSEVNLAYREFHSAPAILASGIPMKAFYNGEEGVMQTAGMFEINAFSGDQTLFLAPGKDIEVNMASYVDGENYDFWSFNEDSGNWENMGPSTPQPNLAKKEAEETIAAMSNIKEPAPPVRFDKKKTVLNFDINLDNYPELKEMKNIFWQYTGKGTNPDKAKWIYSEKWQTAEIVKGKRVNEYTMVLKNEDRSFSTSVCPSQTGKDFDAALKSYENQLEEYKKSALTLDEKQKFMDRQADFVRSFRINKMGIFNYDILMKNPDNLLFAANFDFGETVPNSHSKVNVYLITNDSRSVIAFPYTDRKKFGINPDMDNQLIAILPNNKFATFSQADFNDNLEEMRASHGESFTFKMNVQEAPIDNMDDLEKVIAAL